MSCLPVIVSFGGINAAGRSSFHHGYKRMVQDKLSDAQMHATWQDLAFRMRLDLSHGLTPKLVEEMVKGTLVRAIEPACFDVNAVPTHVKTRLDFGTQGMRFQLPKRKLPERIPVDWQVTELDSSTVEVEMAGQLDVLLADSYRFSVSSAGQLPTGFVPGSLYNSRFHPKGLQLTLYGASDCLQAMGLEWSALMAHIRPDEVAVYAGSGLAQIDEDSLAGMIAEPLRGGRVSSKMMALSLAEMPADFINSYVINSVGTTGTNMGACATFLYNLKQGANDIRDGRAKVVIVGNAEAPVNAQVMEGFRVMGALGEDHQLCALDGSDEPDQRRACRPFSTNCGFTMAESAQFVVLMNDQLALQLGANIHGSVADVFINADANKKSISSPGVGNYVTLAKAAALAASILGEKGLQEQTFVQAHGTGTPQNRVTESQILSLIAQTHGISSWPVAAIKSYVGHSMSVAAGDQLMASLGVWQYGWIPGIKTIDHIADDVEQEGLNILQDHLYVGERGQNMRAVLLNSKGFGGNNASALVLSPWQTQTMLAQKYGAERLSQWVQDNQQVQARAQAYDQAAGQGDDRILYDFGSQVLTHQDVCLSKDELRLTGFDQAITMPDASPWHDYLPKS